VSGAGARCGKSGRSGCVDGANLARTTLVMAVGFVAALSEIHWWLP
jgi:hypothetical protein